jgi:hypothetical protein
MCHAGKMSAIAQTEVVEHTVQLRVVIQSSPNSDQDKVGDIETQQAQPCVTQPHSHGQIHDLRKPDMLHSP